MDENSESSVVKNTSLMRAVRRRVVTVLGIQGLWMGLLFLGAGTFGWPEAWGAFVLYCLGLLANMVYALPRNPEVIAARGKKQEGTKRFDRLIGLPFSLGWLALPVVAGLNQRLQGDSLPAACFWGGAVLLILGAWPVTWALGTNPHLETTVRIQADRAHKVITTGPYRYVRHPMYVGILLQFLGNALILRSRWALIPVAFLYVILIIRTALEDRTLQAELPGYQAFSQQTRFRLFPGIW